MNSTALRAKKQINVKLYLSMRHTKNSTMKN